MEYWESSQRAYLLLEVVKICDKDLLSYFVQCLHQRYINLCLSFK